MSQTTAQSQAAVPLLGLPCATVDVDGAREFAVEAVASGRFHSVLFANAAKVVMAERDEKLRDALLDADLLAADGQSLVWASRVLGQPLPERVAGIDYMIDLLRVGDRHGWRVFFLGGRDQVLREVEAYCRRHHPGLVVAGSHNGYFAPERDAEVAEIVRRADADVLFVGMPSPRKELWIARSGPSSGVSLAVASGGSFDVIAGAVRRAPDFWQRAGLEWLWRVVQEPRRLWKRYLTTNSRFLAMLTRERLRRSGRRLVGR